MKGLILTVCLIALTTALSAQSTFRIDKISDGSLYLVEIVPQQDTTGKALPSKEVPVKFKSEDDLKKAVGGLRDQASIILTDAQKKAAVLEGIANDIMVLLQANETPPAKQKPGKKKG